MATRKEMEDAQAKKAAAAKKDDKAQKGQVRLEYNQATTGLNMDSTINQVKTGSLTYALNATVENFDSSSVNYQNEPGNEPCLSFPDGYELIGKHTIPEKKKNIFFLVNPVTGDSEIGFMYNNDCQYQTLVNAPCLNFNINHPIPKVVHRITNCSTEIYWTDGLNARRYLDIDNIPYKLIAGTPACDPVYSDELDCNQLKIQPNFDIPSLEVEEVNNIGSLDAGTYQFAIQYSDAVGNDLTSYYSVTNPCPIADPLITSVNFNYPVGKSIVVRVSNLDLSGQFQYFNLAVIKTINNITSVELVGTYNIDDSTKDITYSGVDPDATRLSISDIFEKYPYYDIAQDLTSVQDTLIWSNLTSVDRLNYQKIANQIELQWETYRIPATENYADELNATNLRGYMRDEVYTFEIVFLLRNGKQTDAFHIPGPENLNPQPAVLETNPDFIGEPDYYSESGMGYSPYWKIYNNATVIGQSPEFDSSAGDEYKGPYQYGNFAYWESTEEYPCNEDVWGELAGKKIRHHKFPDVKISPIVDNGEIVYEGGQIQPIMQNDAVYPIGVRINNAQISALILASDLTQDEKDDIVAFKIVRGDRGTNRSVIAKGLLRNVNSYKREDQEYYFPNYPYNQTTGEDSFIQENNNAWNGDSKSYLIYMPDGYDITQFPGADLEVEINPGVDEGVFSYVNVINGKYTQSTIKKGCVLEVCSRTRPVALLGVMTIGPGDYDVWNCNGGSGFLSCGWNLNWYNPFNRQNFDGVIQQKKWMTTGGDQKTYGTVITEAYDGEDAHPSKPWSSDHANFAGIDCTNVNINGPQPIGPDTALTNASDCATGEEGFGIPTLPNGPLDPPIDTGSIDDMLLGSYSDPSDSRVGFLWGNNSRRYSRRSQMACDQELPIEPLDSEESKKLLSRQVFNSPDTSFGQPFLGGVLKLESVMFGGGKAHFVQVEDHAKYKLLSVEAQQDALESAERVANMASGNFNAGIMFTVYQSYLTIYVNGITRKNYAMQFNSRANYDYQFDIDNELGIKQREIETARYLIPGVQTIDPNEGPVNNWNRESSVYIKTKETRVVNSFSNSTIEVEPLPLPHTTPSLQSGAGTPLITEYSRFTIGESGNCATPEKENDIKVVSYYASMKNIVPNQWGQINSYPIIDTGYQRNINDTSTSTIFGGDVFISRFTFKTKLPFFIDNRVGAPPDSDVFYDELGNVGYPKYWHSARSILQDYVLDDGGGERMFNLISTKAHNFDCPNDPSAIPLGSGTAPGAGSYRTFYDGYMYLFAYGIPNFYCETVYNTDLRQAFNNKEGDFWPHVSSGIPDDWLQEKNVPIAQDNTYYYNVTFSKQNKENAFTTLPPDWQDELCFTYFPFRAIYSDTQGDSPDNRVNNWLVYRALSFHDFPQNFGDLTSVDGMMDRAVLARFENKALLYNKLLTIDTSNPQAAYIGNPRLFDGAPPVDFAETDLGYVGSQHKFLLKLPYGAVTADAKRGQIFLMSGAKAVDLTAFGSGVNRFITNHLPFEILEYFPDVNVDNNFAGIGLHGVYDSKFDRIIITKLDYIPISNEVKYDAEEKYFYIILPDTDIKQEVYLFDKEYFCSKSWTMSFDFSTKSWISFHSYLPNFYIGENNFYYSGINNCCTQFTAELETPDRSEIATEVPQITVLGGRLKPIDLICLKTADLPNCEPDDLDCIEERRRRTDDGIDPRCTWWGFTTTTSSTSAWLPTTTTTSTVSPDCEFNLVLADEISCGLAGTGVITVPTPTTTTLCQRPPGLNTFQLVEGYQVTSNNDIKSGINNAVDACAVAEVVSAGNIAEAIIPIMGPVQITEYSGNDLISQVVYDGDGSSCDHPVDGWYSITSYYKEIGQVFYIEGGTITEEFDCGCADTTTSTTTLVPYVPDCCAVLGTDQTQLYLLSNGDVLDPELEEVGPTKVQLGIPNYTGGDIGYTSNKLYAYDGTSFQEWDITFSPWSATYIQAIPKPGGFTSNAGIVALSDTKLIGIDTSISAVVELDVTGTTMTKTTKFTIPSLYTYQTSILYSTDGKLVTVGENSGVNYLLEFDYATGTLDKFIPLTSITGKVTGVIECDCNLYIIEDGNTGSPKIYLLESTSPYNQLQVTDSTPSNYAGIEKVAELASCVTQGVEKGTTTTTTTVAPTTTTTTTAASSDCFEYEYSGPGAFNYWDCEGQNQVIQLRSGQTARICIPANYPSGTIPNLTQIGPCP
jgi:hypothetical protein